MNIFITLDYELFSSDNPGTPQRCIIDPMNALDGVADKYGFKFVVFVDAAYLFKLYELKEQYRQLDNEYKLLEGNLRQLVSKGHDVQLHFHPQWIYTEWDGNKGKWKMDISHFKLSDMEPDLAQKSFKKAKNLLDDIIGYKTTCFRACGYCLDTYSEYMQLFKDNGIYKDSSVARYCHVESSAHTYDYRNIPEEHIYRFESSVKEKNDSGNYKEMSISSFLINPIVQRLKLRQYHPGIIYRDGSALRVASENKESMFTRLMKKKRILASIDGGSSLLLPYYLKEANRQCWTDLVMCGHPKNASEGSIKNLDRFLRDNIKNIIFLTSKDV